MTDYIIERDPSVMEPELSKIRARFFTDSAVRIDPLLEGQRVDDGVVVLGCRAGPSFDTDSLIHEMAHFIEIDEPRMASPGWGLRYGRYRSFGLSSWYESRTGAAVERELRVCAIQYWLTREIRECEPLSFAKEWARVLLYLPTDSLYHYSGEASPEKIKPALYAGLLANIEREDLYGLEVSEREWSRRNELLTRNGPVGAERRG